MTWGAVADAVERATGEAVVGHRRLDSLASEVYAVEHAGGDRVVVKVPRVESGRLSSPRVLALLGEATALPLPGVLAVDERNEPSFLVMEYVEGRQVEDPDDLSATELRRFAAEFGRVLGTLHEVEPPVETFGRLRCDDEGALHTVEGFDSWRPRLADTLAVNLDALAELRLGDLAAPVREHLEDALPAVPDVTEPALHYHDCKVSNVVLSEDPEGDPFAAVLDWEALETTHWAYTLAFPEAGFARRQTTLQADAVLEELHTGYADARGWEGVELEEPWFDTYRLAAHVLEAASPYWLEGRDDWDDEEARELREAIEGLL